MTKKEILIQYLLEKCYEEIVESDYQYTNEVGDSIDINRSLRIANSELNAAHDLIVKLEDLINEMRDLINEDDTKGSSCEKE